MTTQSHGAGAGALNRRGFLHFALARAVVPVLGLPVLAACADIAASGPSASGRGGRDFALLLPRTGEAASLGENMARAASLVTQSGDIARAPPIYDTQDTPEGSVNAARQAIENGAKILLGPLRADQTAGVLAVAGTRPVITFSNDDGLAADGAFVMGITPAQSVATLFSYARARGVTRIALLARAGPLAQATEAAARALASAAGITITAALQRDPGDGGLVAAIGAGSPQAIYLPEGGATLTAFARALRGSDLQLLGSVQWGMADVTADANLDGAWFASPPPDLFLPFAARFEAAFGTQPGVVAALGHDAALLAVGLGDGRSVNRQGITREAGFTGVLGPFRFADTGQCQRDLAVLGVRGGTYTLLAEVSGT
jgi:branched-chain amino acid transport system substrate-binding protein